jgi:hypothetical protein
MRVNWAFHEAMWIFYRKHHRRTYGPVVTAAVMTGIAGKFLLSAMRSAVLRATARAHRWTRTPTR